ncbi:GMC family oxidoreductase [Tsukamurella paurometabola]|uniref:GMC family oxidoreductase N-terminal domain-containing protein n=1 Tax=Tsukamurella paurometabola TaxID=2061 RepID=A0ABS5NFA4_TSUPA|nr:GMC family oxidoreductase N-terminal domain-containing protein [Tsukamurella paurometabola]MBS4102980.1 GMC family oxidoreductase N-terminal domain-containing protein [Tsukamurella paurometabola]
MSFDYIVVGSGSAGAPLAARLSEDPGINVLLIEAGRKERGISVKIPAAFSKQFRTDLDWEYETEAEPHLGGRKLYHPRGKMLGGCSAQNAMMYIRGNRHDFDSWADGGAKGWSYDEVLPYFKRSESNSRGADAYHGADGPLSIEDLRSPNPLSQRILEAMVGSGIPANHDFNGSQQEGVGFYQVTQRRGQRWTTADGYLYPNASRSNLTIWTGAQVHRLDIVNGHVVGLRVEREGAIEIVRADREVILAAGAFGTPHLLMLSGIGPADHLREHGIEPVVDNAHVGDHLMDHPFYLVNMEVNASGTMAEAEKPIQLLKYLALRRGLLTSNVAEVGGFIHTRNDPAPDMQFIGASSYFWDNGFASHSRPAMAIGCSLVGARSTGTVRLKSGDPQTKPAIAFNYFSHPADMKAMVSGVRRAHEIAMSSFLRDVVIKELHPGPGVVNDAKQLEEEIRRNVIHTYHPTCTARIGVENEGVVDPELRVYGVQGLRVADASVFPTITHGNTHAPTVMVGERAADLILGRRA